MGFPVPTYDWFRKDLLTDIRTIISGLKDIDLFEPDALDRLVNRHKDGIEDNSKMLMTLLVFAEWREQYL